MNKLPAQPTTEFPWRYEPDGQMIVVDAPDDPVNNGKMIADVRGWGWLQYMTKGSERQDANGELLAQAGAVHHRTSKTPEEMEQLVIRLSFALRGMLDVYATICDTQGWDRHHMNQYTEGEKLVNETARFKVST